VRVSAIVVFPVKSCRGIAMTSARVEKRGLALDRRWMIADELGRFVTQREEPRLCLVDVAIDGDRLRLSADGCGEVVLPVTTEEGTRVEVDVWGRRMQSVAHDEASRWTSAFLSRPVRVVHLPDRFASPLASRRALPGDEVSFADGYPLLVATEESLDDLGARIEARGGERVPMARFRPNVVVQGAPAWDEDAWATFTLGAVTVRAPKPCERCVITTIDPATARAGPEPLRTLASFRKRERGVWFAINVVPVTLGDVAVGDDVRVLERVEPPAFETRATTDA
jgi:uncharacterized protein YcbX